MKRIDMERLQEMVRLHRLGTSVREVARMLKMSPNTERTYRHALQQAELLSGPVNELPALDVLKEVVAKYVSSRPRVQHESSIERWLAQIEEMVIEKNARPKAIHDRLKRENEDFTGSVSAVKRACARIRKAQGISADDVAIPVETVPGEVAQVDFGSIGKLFDPDKKMMRKAYVFVMVLGYSRHQFCAISFDQKVQTWLSLHIKAFEFFSSVPRVIRPDNLKSAVIRGFFTVGEPTVLNRSYRELAQHFGFKIDPTPVYSPQKKGKVESGVKYVKNNFFKPMMELDARVLGIELEKWVLKTAGTRIHGTTAKRPIEVFEREERGCMLPLPVQRFEMVQWAQAKVQQDTHIKFDKALYSVPWRWVGKKVLVRATVHSVQIHGDDGRLATHEKALPGQRRTIDEHLPPHRREFRHRNRSYWVKRARSIDKTVAQYINEVFDSDDVLELMNVVMKIVTHLETFPRHRAIAACKRAQFFGNYTYKGIRNILRQGIENHPLPNLISPETTALETPRFARTVQELLDFHMEDKNEYH